MISQQAAATKKKRPWKTPELKKLPIQETKGSMAKGGGNLNDGNQNKVTGDVSYS